jgi:hypothetical protein
MKRAQTNVLHFPTHTERKMQAAEDIDLNELLVRDPEATWIFSSGDKILVVERGLSPEMYARVITEDSEGKFLVENYEPVGVAKANRRVFGTVRHSIVSFYGGAP